MSTSITSRYSPLRTAERGARIPETALLSASQFFLFFQNLIPRKLSFNYSIGRTHSWRFSIFVKYHVPVLLHQVCTYQVLRCWITMHAQLRSVQLYIDQQRSAAPCGAVPGRALPCAVLSFEHIAVPGILRVLFAFSSFDFSRSPGFSPHANYTRIADQNVAPPTSTAQHRAICSAQAALGNIKSLFAPNYGPLLFALFTCFSCILRCASVAGGVSRPGAEPLYINTWSLAIRIVRTYVPGLHG